ncbi:hypothetical protein MKEN_00417100 [Mycena kentingensis (nom. inval.)]|nr:hypothetical protein MKEN_00417100 [Mycena kentingensis (nom. inval.)]
MSSAPPLYPASIDIAALTNHVQERVVKATTLRAFERHIANWRFPTPGATFWNWHAKTSDIKTVLDLRDLGRETAARAFAEMADECAGVAAGVEREILYAVLSSEPTIRHVLLASGLDPERLHPWQGQQDLALTSNSNPHWHAPLGLLDSWAILVGANVASFEKENGEEGSGYASLRPYFERAFRYLARTGSKAIRPLISGNSDASDEPKPSLSRKHTLEDDADGEDEIVVSSPKRHRPEPSALGDTLDAFVQPTPVSAPIRPLISSDTDASDGPKPNLSRKDSLEHAAYEEEKIIVAGSPKCHRLEPAALEVTPNAFVQPTTTISAPSAEIIENAAPEIVKEPATPSQPTATTTPPSSPRVPGLITPANVLPPLTPVTPSPFGIFASLSPTVPLPPPKSMFPLVSPVQRQGLLPSPPSIETAFPLASPSPKARKVRRYTAKSKKMSPLVVSPKDKIPSPPKNASPPLSKPSEKVSPMATTKKTATASPMANGPAPIALLLRMAPPNLSEANRTPLGERRNASPGESPLTSNKEDDVGRATARVWAAG